MKYPFTLKSYKSKCLEGNLNVPSDKSISLEPTFSNIVVFPAAPNDDKRIALFTWADPEVSL